MRSIALAFTILLLGNLRSDENPVEVVAAILQRASTAPQILFTVTEVSCGTGKTPCLFTQNIWTIKADGSGARQLTNFTIKGNVCSAPAWSPDGSTILFGCTANPRDANKSDNVLHYWTMNAEGSDLRPLPGRIWDPAWSPDGQKLAFISSRSLDDSVNQHGPVSGNIWVMNSDGHGAAPITQLTSDIVTARYVLWSPDGSKLAFLSNRALDGSDRRNGKEGIFNLWMVNADGSEARPLTRFTAVGINVLNVKWSPDGKRLAFLSNCAHDGRDALAGDLNTNIWVAKPDGSGVQALTQFHNVSVRDLDWSPDGIRLAFSSTGALDGSDAAKLHFTQNIWVMKADGSSAFPLTRATEFGYDNGYPLWSPDGTMISFTSAHLRSNSNQLTGDIRVIKPDGSSLVPLTHFIDRAAVATAWHR